MRDRMASPGEAVLERPEEIMIQSRERERGEEEGEDTESKRGRRACKQKYNAVSQDRSRLHAARAQCAAYGAAGNA